MSNFASGYIKYINHLEQINEGALKTPERMIREIENSYQEHIRNVARNIAEEHKYAKIAMLSGPSSSGKTTTAHILQGYLEQFGIRSVIISLDNFYRGRDAAPLLPDGTRDYESIEALRVDKLKECLNSLVTTGKFSVPEYNFALGRPEEKETEYTVTDKDIVIIEGIHALNPNFTKELPEEKLIKLYVSVKQPIKDANGEVATPLDLRLTRRIIRDVRTRGTSAETTLQMWTSVIAGEDKYIRPYRITADYTINTIHIYEPCVMRKQAISLLREIPQDSPYYRKARDLESHLMRFEPIDETLVPEHSMLREFIGSSEK
ncbi:uridine kinase family protein [Scatolibacter rhodanostii]|uniref:uridine kinase family protein n=1 Tax=Scatolibacter rhodanostii TaxID=2014781 RepID=UPI0013565436|nr:nucleoside kinase [Scatolibacter rhodanostii]